MMHKHPAKEVNKQVYPLKTVLQNSDSGKTQLGPSTQEIRKLRKKSAKTQQNSSSINSYLNNLEKLGKLS